VTVLRTVGRRTIQTRNGPLQVLGLPWVIRSAFLARDEYKNATLQELNDKMIELASDKLKEEAQQLDPSQPAIVVAHAHVYGARVGAERMLTMGVDPVFNLEVFANLPHVDYVALGHIHKHQVLSHAHPPVVYAGSLNRVDFSEEKEPKGFILADVERGACGWEFVPVKARPFLTLDVRAEDDDPTQTVLKAVFSAGERVRESVVRLRIETTRAAALQLDQDEIRSQLREAFYLLPIQIELLDGERERAIGRDFQGKTPLELLQVYLEEKNVPADRRENLAAFARTLMDEPA
jgi:exonuclease SbcD